MNQLKHFNFNKRRTNMKLPNTNVKTNVKTNMKTNVKIPNKKIVRFVIYFIIIIIIVILFFFIAKLLMYLFVGCEQRKDLGTYLSHNSLNPCITMTPQTAYDVRKIEDEKEVYHIADQLYTYDQGQKKCAAYGARMANKTDMLDAYYKGAQWCTYGWTEGQNAFYCDKKQNKRACSVNEDDSIIAFNLDKWSEYDS